MKRIIAFSLVAMITFSSTAYAQEDSSELRIAKLENKMEELEARISSLEKTIFNNEIAGTADSWLPNNDSNESDESFTLSSGIYIIGEDIDAGTYSFVCIEGVSDINIYNDYDSAVSENYMFNYVFSYYLISKGYASMLGQITDSDYSGAFPDIADNVRLDAGQVMRIDGGTCELVKKK